MIQKVRWMERRFVFGLPAGMLPFYLERLRGTAARIEEKVRGLPEDILSEKLDGKWSVKQNMGHLAEIDEIADKRIDEILAGVTPMSPAVFEPKHDYNAMAVTDVLAFFRESRARNLAHYSALTADELVRSSLHPRLKEQMTAVDLAWFDAEHDDHHLERMNEIIKTLRP